MFIVIIHKRLPMKRSVHLQEVYFQVYSNMFEEVEIDGNFGCMTQDSFKKKNLATQQGLWWTDWLYWVRWSCCFDEHVTSIKTRQIVDEFFFFVTDFHCVRMMNGDVVEYTQPCELEILVRRTRIAVLSSTHSAMRRSAFACAHLRIHWTPRPFADKVNKW